ncbi:MAG: deoxyribonuclease IV [Desulfarculus sp.]|nr:MAG: deoxyribonuclease IV [Desulfarculus sp.]
MRFGLHLSVAQGLEATLAQAKKLRLECLQIFAGTPRTWRQKPLDPDQAAAFRQGLAALGLEPVVVHAPYLINLASPERGLWQRSIAALAEQIERARALGAAAVVVHPGSRGQRGLDWGLARAALGVARALEAAGEGAACWLENTAGGGGHLGGGLAELAELLARLPGRPVGAVLDTAHAWAAGYDLAGAPAVAGFLDEVERALGLERVRMWHLNDSLHPRGSRRDQHTHLGRGLLGGGCFAALAAEPRLAQAGGVMETPKDSPRADPRNLAYMRRLRTLAGRRGRRSEKPWLAGS